MNKRKKILCNHWHAILIVGAVLVMIPACQSSVESQRVDAKYHKEIKDWQQKRLEGLKAKDGWLSLVGLFWLKEGDNTFGSDPANDFVVDEVKAPPFIGTFTLGNGRTRFKTREGVTVLQGNVPIKEIMVEDDSSQKPTVLETGSLSWFIISRGERLGVRVRDANSPHLNQLKSIETFPVDPAWRLDAVLERYEKPRKIMTPTVIGTISEMPTPGPLVFKIKGKVFRLMPIGGEDDLFVIFADKTNTQETYGGGRFLYVGKADEQGRTVIDFNKAFNPPCAFSAYATCPLPPRENYLPIRVTAGEKMVKGVGH